MIRMIAGFALALLVVFPNTSFANYFCVEKEVDFGFEVEMTRSLIRWTLDASDATSVQHYAVLSQRSQSGRTIIQARRRDRGAASTRLVFQLNREDCDNGVGEEPLEFTLRFVIPGTTGRSAERTACCEQRNEDTPW